MTQPLVTTGTAAPATGAHAPTGGGASDRPSLLRRLSGDHLTRTASVITLLLLWMLGSMLLPSTVLPGPVLVVEQLIKIMANGDIWPHLVVTLGRVVGAFCVAMIVASVLGVLMGMNSRIEKFFDSWLVIGMTIPALVTIIVVFMTVGMNETGTIVAAALVTIPMLTVNVWEGVKSIDSRLIDMAKAFRNSRFTIIRSVVLPQLAPTLLASARFGLGLVWKMILFIELLGRSDGVGYQVQHYYMLFNMTQVLAYAIGFLIIMLVIEMGIFGFIEHKLFHWRRSPSKS
ncbi:MULTISPECIES: ABC transporter permease [unclassified Salinibacterium]|uniref:ABC transporter permease n=1 Tax=unclassified Salinibacterium TaxID=2632331 RepID=UPI00143D9F2E|nr:MULTISPECIES: ABC transporter permease [unclassified Salinibacterium]